MVNKAGISAPMVAFGKDPSLFPLWAAPHCLKKKKIYPLFPLSWALPDCNKGLNWHTHTDLHKHTQRAHCARLCVCVVVHVCMCTLAAGRCLSIQQAAWPAHQKGLHLHNSNTHWTKLCQHTAPPVSTHPSTFSVILLSTFLSFSLLPLFHLHVY